MEVRKQSGSNTVDVAEAVEEALPVLNRELPAQTRLSIVKDSSHFIKESVEDVENALILGAIFTIFIVFLFLNSWRSTVITGLTLPVSIISAFIIMKMLGLLEEGEGVVIFPEGTYYKKRMGPGHRGLIRIVLSHIDSLFIPVGIRYTERTVRTHVLISIGKPVGDLFYGNSQEMTDYIMKKIAELSGLQE